MFLNSFRKRRCADEEDEQKQTSEQTQPKGDKSDEESVDDFLLDANEDTNVFQKTTAQLSAFDNVRGDKSKGWETQRQRPGQFKRRRVRR